MLFGVDHKDRTKSPPKVTKDLVSQRRQGDEDEMQLPAGLSLPSIMSARSCDGLTAQIGVDIPSRGEVMFTVTNVSTLGKNVHFVSDVGARGA
jgi:hypothetical protein